MLINPNLSTISEFNSNSIQVYNDSLNISFIDSNTIKIKKKKEAEFGMVYVNLFDDIEVNKKIVFSGMLYIIQGEYVRTYYNGFSAENGTRYNLGKNLVKSEGLKNKGWNQAQIRVYHDNEVIFRYTKIKLEKDEVTPYIPHKDTIETAKRQYFIGGGYFKEVYPIS